MVKGITMEEKLKYLEFIQNIITRMNSNSFIIKGWSITLSTAIFLITKSNQEFFLLPYTGIIIFWGLDAFYLSQERKYIVLYNKVSNKEKTKIDFNLNVKNINDENTSWINCLFSKTILSVYVSLIAIIIAMMFN